MNIHAAAFEGAAGFASQLPPPDLPEVAFSGRSNVGKSSLINRLLCRKSLARTSATPGKTVTINFYNAGDTRLVDLPGYGYAKVSKQERLRWSELVEGYFQGERGLRLVLQLIDFRHPPTVDDISMLQYLAERRLPCLVALTKADKLKKSERQSRWEEMQKALSFLGEATPLIPFSAVTGEGTEEIRKKIEDAVRNG